MKENVTGPTEQRLIDANALKEKMQENHDFFVDGVGGFRYLTPKDKARVDEITHCIAEITNAPAVDAVEVVHAEWLDGSGISRDGSIAYESIDCSHCVEVFKIETHDREYWKARFKVCPFCGAIMDGERKNKKC